MKLTHTCLLEKIYNEIGLVGELLLNSAPIKEIKIQCRINDVMGLQRITKFLFLKYIGIILK